MHDWGKKGLLTFFVLIKKKKKEIIIHDVSKKIELFLYLLDFIVKYEKLYPFHFWRVVYLKPLRSENKGRYKITKLN